MVSQTTHKRSRWLGTLPAKPNQQLFWFRVGIPSWFNPQSLLALVKLALYFRYLISVVQEWDFLWGFYWVKETTNRLWTRIFSFFSGWWKDWRNYHGTWWAKLMATRQQQATMAGLLQNQWNVNAGRRSHRWERRKMVGSSLQASQSKPSISIAMSLLLQKLLTDILCQWNRESMEGRCLVLVTAQL